MSVYVPILYHMFWYLDNKHYRNNLELFFLFYFTRWEGEGRGGQTVRVGQEGRRANRHRMQVKPECVCTCTYLDRTKGGGRWRQKRVWKTDTHPCTLVCASMFVSDK